MSNQHSQFRSSPQQQGAPRNSVLKELCALSPSHVNNAAPGKCQLPCSYSHEAQKPAGQQPSWAVWGLFGVFRGTGRRGDTQNSSGVMYLFYCFCRILELSSHVKCSQVQAQDRQG